MSFRDRLAERSAATYAGFLLPHLPSTARMLDCGCGAGTITVGLADSVGSIVGLDLDAKTLAPAAAYVRGGSIPNVRFVAGDGMRLPFRDEAFDAVLMHSVLEAATDPSGLAREAWRVLVPGGVLAAASVEYGGLVLEGPDRETLTRFYAVREQLWSLERVARPRAGRALRRLLHGCGFGEARAADCAETWFVSHSLAHRLYTEEELERTRRAWEVWSRSPDAFLAFAWCRVVGRKPGR